MESLDENNVYRIKKGRVLDEDDEPIKDVIAVGLQNLVEGNKNPLSEYNEAFWNLQARRWRKPVIPGSAKEKTAATEFPSPAHLEVNLNATIYIQVPLSQRQVGASESGVRMAVARDDMDKEAEDTVDKDEIKLEMSFFYQPTWRGGETEQTFATIGPDIRKKPDEYIVRCSQCSTSRSIDCPLIYRTTVVTHLTYIVL